MPVLEFTEKEETSRVTTDSLTLLDLIAALNEETEDDALVAAAVVDLFASGQVRFQSGEKVIFV